MSTPTSTPDPVAEVRALLERYTAAVRQLDLPAITSHYADDVVAYDAIYQLEFSGRAAYAAHWQSCLEHCKMMIFEPREPVIHASGDVAFGHYLLRCGGVGPDGKEHIGWMRATFAARKEQGRWLIVHEHYSVPFDPLTEKMLTGLEPQATQPARRT